MGPSGIEPYVVPPHRSFQFHGATESHRRFEPHDRSDHCNGFGTYGGLEPNGSFNTYGGFLPYRDAAGYRGYPANVSFPSHDSSSIDGGRFQKRDSGTTYTVRLDQVMSANNVHGRAVAAGPSSEQVPAETYTMTLKKVTSSDKLEENTVVGLPQRLPSEQEDVVSPQRTPEPVAALAATALRSGSHQHVSSLVVEPNPSNYDNNVRVHGSSSPQELMLVSFDSETDEWDSCASEDKHRVASEKHHRGKKHVSRHQCTLSELAGDDFVNIYIVENSKQLGPFPVARLRLDYVSTWFHERLEDTFIDAAKTAKDRDKVLGPSGPQHFVLDDVSMQVFEIFLNYLYRWDDTVHNLRCPHQWQPHQRSGCARSNCRTEYDAWVNRQLDLYIFAHKYDVQRLRNRTITSLSMSNMPYVAHYYPLFSTILQAYSALPSESGDRRRERQALSHLRRPIDREGSSVWRWRVCAFHEHDPSLFERTCEALGINLMREMGSLSMTLREDDAEQM